MVKHDIAAKLGMTIDARRSSDHLADETGLNREYLYRMMRALTSDGIFKEWSGGVNREFGHTPLSLKLSEPVQRDIGRLYTMDTYYKGYDNFEDSIKAGESQIGKSLGAKSLWDYLATNETEHSIFYKGMTAFATMQDVPSTADLGDYSKFDIVTDTNPNIKQGINFDRPEVLENREIPLDYDPRYSDISGDFFGSVPQSDCFVLKGITHNWNDDKVLELLSVVTASLNANGKVYIYDYIVDSPTMKDFLPWFDMYMLHLFSGKERSLSDWVSITERAGYNIENILYNQVNPLGHPL
eukprot:gene20532-24656_t